MRIRWIEPLYGFSGPDQTHIAVAESASRNLHRMKDELLGTDNLIAIYVPESTPVNYDAQHLLGLVIGAVRLLEMPPNRSIRDYAFTNWEGELQWPIGWPCQTVLAVPPERAPRLRDLVAVHMPRVRSFGDYAAQFQSGPFQLAFEMQNALMGVMRDLFGREPWADNAPPL